MTGLWRGVTPHDAYLIIHKILYSWVPCEIEHLLWHLISYPHKSHFHGLRSLSLDSIVCNAYHTAVALSQRTGVLGWGWPRLAKVFQKIIAVWQLRNNAPSSAFTADATTNRMTVVLMWKAPFKLWVRCLQGFIPWKNVRMYGSTLPELKGKMRRNVCSLSYLTRKILPLLGCCLPDNPAIVRTSPMSYQWPFVCFIAMELRAMRTVMSTARA